MKKIGLLFLAFSFIATIGMAQRKVNNNRGQGHIMKELNLTAEQKSQMKTFRADTKKQMEDLKSQNLSDAERHEKSKAIKNAQREKMMSILTPEQKTKFEQSAKRNEKGLRDNAQRKNNFNEKLEKLSLTDQQKEAIKSKQQELKDKRQNINNSNLSDAQKKEALKNLKDERKESFNKILSKEQKQKMKEFRKQHNKNDRTKK